MLEFTGDQHRERFIYIDEMDRAEADTLLDKNGAPFTGADRKYIYDNVVEECIHGQEGRIDRFIKRSQEYLDANFKDWIVAIKDFLINTIRGVILPMIMDLIWRSKTSSKVEMSQEPVI